MATSRLLMNDQCQKCLNLQVENAVLKARVQELETMLALSGKPISDDTVVTTTGACWVTLGVEPIRYVHIVCPTCAAIRQLVEGPIPLTETDTRRVFGRIRLILDKAGVPGGKEKA